jgi:Domain of unknown function (DUF5710)
MGNFFKNKVTQKDIFTMDFLEWILSYFCCCLRRKESKSKSSDRLYLVVPFSKKDQAKALGARWDPVQQKWYAQTQFSELLSKFKIYEPVSFIGENRLFGGNLLYVDMIPSSCSENVRSNVSEETWETIRYTVRDRSRNTCELCRICCKATHCHERFSYDMKTKTQKLERLLCVCEDCHGVIHFGFSKNIKKNGDKTREHLKKVRGMTDEEVDKHVKEAYELRYKQDKVDWKLDISILHQKTT